MTKGERRKLQELLNLMTTIGKETGHGDISLHQIKTLLYAALRDSQDDPAESREIAKHLGLSTSGISRSISSLGAYGRGKRPGLDLLQAKEDLNDRRRKPVMLTRKGRKVINAILEVA